MDTRNFILLIAASTCVTVASLLLALGRLNHELAIKRRLAAFNAREKKIASASGKIGRRKSKKKMTAIINSMSLLSVPQEGWQSNEVRLRFIQAGYREPQASQIFYAAKSFLAIILPCIIAIIAYSTYGEAKNLNIPILVLLSAALGYYAPEFFLRNRANLRRKEMREVLPDLIELLAICVESGLGLDQAINRVSREIARRSRMVAEEFHLLTLETRAGAGRILALRNLSLRVGLDDLTSFTSTLIQADKFGTSISEALRVQAELMRVRRMQLAEKAAAKVPTKMLIPLVLCIFPVLMLVMMGPAVMLMISAFKSLK